MCGIVGWIGKRPAAPLLLEGLQKLEYRGYDSAGIALLDGSGLSVYKKKGRLQVLCELLEDGAHLPQTVGIGHTRWATHGKPNDVNAHPHVSQSGRFAIVHNGIIENHRSLRMELTEKGYAFTSETDSEVIAQLLEDVYDGDLPVAIRRVMSRLEGSYALGILCADEPDVLYAVRSHSPLIIGLEEAGEWIASDIPAVLSHTRRVIRLLDGDMARLTPDGVQLWDASGHPTDRSSFTVDWDVAAAEKDGHPHFMLKEILEQPRALEDTIAPRVTADGAVRLDDVSFTEEELRRLRRIVVVGCGSAYHAGVAGKYYLEAMVGIPVEVDVASEFRYREPLVDDTALVIVISQSGETADTLAALREAKRRGARVLSVVNVVGSTIAVESDDVLYTRAGPEIAVATTKGYTTQVAMLYLIGLYLAQRLSRPAKEETAAALEQLRRLPTLARQSLSLQRQAERIAADCVELHNAYFIGRHMDYAVALEASLKLKEISYIHSEAYAAGELKHGTISLVEDGTFVVALACRSELTEKVASNVREVKARGARVLVVTDEAHRDDFPEADARLVVPTAPPLLAAIPQAVALQLLAYYIALYRGCDIDKPRNLAKSVTVE